MLYPKEIIKAVADILLIEHDDIITRSIITFDITLLRIRIEELGWEMKIRCEGRYKWICFLVSEGNMGVGKAKNEADAVICAIAGMVMRKTLNVHPKLRMRYP